MSSTLVTPSSLVSLLNRLLPRARTFLTGALGASALAFLFVETAKCWPGSYHVRLLIHIFRARFFPRKLYALNVPIGRRNRVRLSDLDWHGHVNNAQYALDADIKGRYPWITSLMMNKGTPFRGHAAIGGAVYFFQSELRWGMRYRIETQAVGADDKWIYLESRWYIEDSGKKKHIALVATASAGADLRIAAPRAAEETDTLAAVKVTRLVFKEGSGPLRGKTIKPRDVFADLGFEVPASFEHSKRIGEFFREAYEITTTSESGMRQDVEGDCSHSAAAAVRSVG